MRTLIAGAGATGGYLADELTTGGRDVTVLVREGTRDRLATAGLRVRGLSGDIRTTPVRAVVADGIDTIFDLVLVAVRGDAVEVGVLTELAAGANRYARMTPLLDAAVVAIELHNSRLADRWSESAAMCRK